MANTTPQPDSTTVLFQLESFDTAVPVNPADEELAKRRFMTLMVTADRFSHGNTGLVLQAHNTSNERFTVKVLADNTLMRALGTNTPSRTADESAMHLANTAALFEEYRNLCRVSYLRGFPHVYGYGTCQGEPLILMEWIEGTSLDKVTSMLPHDGEGVTCTATASVGCAVLGTLLSTRNLETPLVHRDLSPANIMFRTNEIGIDEQVRSMAFKPCLVDMGSSVPTLGSDTLTQRADIWRYATPAYAAPEMLTRDIPNIAGLRRSPAVDVYAIASILYELYSGHTIPLGLPGTRRMRSARITCSRRKTNPSRSLPIRVTTRLLPTLLCPASRPTRHRAPASASSTRACWHSLPTWANRP